MPSLRIVHSELIGGRNADGCINDRSLEHIGRGSLGSVCVTLYRVCADAVY